MCGLAAAVVLSNGLQACCCIWEKEGMKSLGGFAQVKREERNKRRRDCVGLGWVHVRRERERERETVETAKHGFLPGGHRFFGEKILF